MSGIIEASSMLRKRKHLKRGINFTIMIVGQSGCGRSTFINTLCGQQVVENSTSVLLPTDQSQDIELQLREETVELEDDEGVKIQLNIIDTPGLGLSLNNSIAFEIISDYIKHQYDEILLEESRVRRNPRFKDGRVHCILYLIEPTGHGLKEIDVEFMKQLGNLANIIPIICKADSLTPDELKLNKKLILNDINKYNLPIFNFPMDENEVTQEDYETNIYLRGIIPFSIISSNDVFTNDDGQIIRGRKYPWGVIDVEDSNVSDFVILRNTLLISHLHDFKEFTHEILYERYRTEALSGGHNNTNNSNDKNKTSNNSDAGVNNANTDKSNDTSVDESSTNDQTNNTYFSREEQIRLEEERLRAFEERVQQELLLKRQELLQRENELKEIEKRLERESAK